MIIHYLKQSLHLKEEMMLKLVTLHKKTIFVKVNDKKIKLQRSALKFNTV